ncbi:MAG: Cyclic di-GMP phosphodiesterase response regulator RpfG [Candidatus Dichloromethanomonas elyunquensis]|nr:MAG: Cyclic di-GMP phosphodiesterase response regulator RpfG [Candidatus Dichloromethanomonas elyunquensis]
MELFQNVLTGINAYLQKLYNNHFYLNSNYFAILSFIFFIIILFTFIFVNILKRKMRDLENQNDIIDQLLQSIDVQSDLNKQLNAILDIVISIVDAEGYFIYLWDKTSENYVLRITKYKTSERGVVAVSYSGLAPYEKEKYDPPLGISGRLTKNEVLLIKDGEVPLLRMAISHGKCQMRIGPIKKITPKKQRQLKILCEKIDRIVDMYLTMDKLNNDVEVITTTGKAITELSKSAFKIETLGSKIMGISSQMVEAGGCCYAIQDKGKWRVPLITRLTNDIDQEFVSDNEALDGMKNVLDGHSYMLIQQGSKDFYSIPYYLVASGIQSVLLVETQGVEGMAIFFFNRLPRLENYSISVVLMMTKRLGELWENREKLRALSDSYVHMLRILIDSTDNLDPTTVGHSELIANYSTAIALELDLPKKEIESIRMAAYFHDIGMLGLSNEILYKQGKYSQIEFETMKLHSVIGASIIESTTSRDEVALYIKHHHERWDGYGYPDRLKQEQIPLGARIMAVADMFNAKLQGRKYREPVTYERAVTDLLAASGTQLDPKLVETLLSWLNRKREIAIEGRALGPCWEIKCCPVHISEGCAAYGRKDTNCWDIEDVNCAQHGSQCSTCFVKTEMLSRSRSVNP